MSFWIVKQEMEPLDLTKYSKAAQGLRIALEKEIGDLYRTQCILCGNQEAHVKYFLWVKTETCIGCGKEISLFPGNVQYAELMDFCYVWLRKLVGEHVQPFGPTSTRTQNELTGNEQMGRNLLTFTEGLTSVFRQMARALKPGSPMVFTYHHNALSAYYPVAVAILDAGLTCSASLPCPGEMGASIHINGTGSSIIDTVFVCRTTGRVPRRWVPEDAEGLSALVEEDLGKLRLANVAPTIGDMRCIYFGHMVRLAIWSLRKDWKRNLVTQTKLDLIQSWINGFKGLSQIERFIESKTSAMPQIRISAVREKKPEGYDKEIAF